MRSVSGSDMAGQASSAGVSRSSRPPPCSVPAAAPRASASKPPWASMISSPHSPPSSAAAFDGGRAPGSPSPPIHWLCRSPKASMIACAAARPQRASPSSSSRRRWPFRATCVCNSKAMPTTVLGSVRFKLRGESASVDSAQESSCRGEFIRPETANLAASAGANEFAPTEDRAPQCCFSVFSVGLSVESAVQAASFSGNVRNRWPLAMNRALATAGAMTGVAGSPTPVGGSADATMCTSTRGIRSMRSTR